MHIDLAVIAGEDATVTLATRELSTLLSRLGIRVSQRPPLNRDADSSRRSSDLTIILRSPSGPENQRAASEQFDLRPGPGQVEIIGASPVGLLHGVYHFLETVVGYSFALPGEDGPPADGLVGLRRRLRSLRPFQHEPSFRLRERTLLNGQDFHNTDPFNLALLPYYIDWMAKNKLNSAHLFFVDYRLAYWAKVKRVFPAMRERGIRIAVGDHLYRFFAPETTLRRRHPEWFREMSTRRPADFVSPDLSQAHFCGANRQAVRHFVRGVERYLVEAPGIDMLAVHPNDGGPWCECRRCARLSVSDRYLQIHLALAEAVAHTRPEIVLVHNAYGSYMPPPRRFRPAENMVVLLQPWGRDFRYAFNHRRCPVHHSRRNMMETSCVDYQRHLDAWLAVCARAGVDLYIHEKYARQLLLGCHLFPPPCLADDLRFFHRMGVAGVQLHAGMGGWWTSATTLAIASRLLWDVSSSAETLTDEVLRRQYSRVAGRVAEVLAHYESAAGSWQYANSNVNFNLYRSLGPFEQPPAGLAAFNRQLIESIEACLPALRDLRGDITQADAVRQLGLLVEALDYVYQQRRVLAADLGANAALRSAETSNRADRLASVRQAARAVMDGRRWAEQAGRLGVRGRLHGTCWDLGSPAAGEKISSVRYAW